MRNPEDFLVQCRYHLHSSSIWTPKTLLLVVLVLLYSARSIQTLDYRPDGSTEVQWQILTKLNFSTQIRLNPHILLMVTVPWYGESRSLMNELAHVVNHQQEKFDTLKLMLVYRNSDRMLADALGATEGITVLYFHQSLSYKYHGTLRVQNILSSVHHVMSLLPEDIPFKSLHTPEHLKSFIESTDKALLLLEFCGWTPRLIAKGKNNGTDSKLEGFLGKGFNLETNGTFSAAGKKSQKKMDNEQMSCGVDSEFSGIPWSEQFSPINESGCLESKNKMPSLGVSCSFEAFQRFESYLPKLMTVVREFFLTPERLRFGLVSERSLLSSLGIQDSGPWSMMLYFAGCPSCSKILREGDDIKSALQMQGSPVIELEGDGHDLEPALPANKPSVVLFIDRSSESLEIRKKCKEALDAFKELALYHQKRELNTAKSQKSAFGTCQSASEFGHPRLEMSPVSQKVTTLNDKMSIMIMNDGKHVSLDKVASDLQGNSLREILTYVLQHNKEIKLSSLAKDVGFELLSDDFAIKVAEFLPAELKGQSNQVSLEDLKGSSDISKDLTPRVAGVTAKVHEELSKYADTERSQHEDRITFDSTSKLLSVEGLRDDVVANAPNGKGQEINSDVESMEHRVQFPGFRGSFFFSDGQQRLLKALVSVSKIPTVVIADPLSQQHYVLTEEEVINYSSLSDFLDRFLNGSILPYQRSESVIRNPREAPTPPIVNLDFHEVDSLPRVTTNTFFELVVGNQSDSINADISWKKDVLVLFSNNWCGFCQRMELVVREVFRAFKGFAGTLKDEIRKEKSSFTSDDVENANLKLPLIFLMDCTLNDCSLILKSMNQRELYPSLLLFPAERKKAVSYGGDMAVSDIIDFIADHGINSQRFFREKGIIRTRATRGARNDNLHKDVSQVAIDKESSSAQEIYHEVLLNDRVKKTDVLNNQIRPRRSSGSQENPPQVVAGSILFASDTLQNVPPFDGSKVLIVKVNRSTGFQGLIINKHISWDSLGDLQKGLELLKEAPLSLGGPVIIRGMPLVALTRNFVKDSNANVLPETYFLDQWETLGIIEGFKVKNQSISDYWFFMGYSSWIWEQLFDEIAEGAWNISNDNVEELEWPSR